MNPILPLWVLSVGAGAGDPALSLDRLDRFSAAWSVHFALVSRLDASPNADGKEAAERVEALLDTAQTSLGALRPEEAQQALAEAERTLQSHPELPQAAWLLAESYTLGAAWLAHADPAAARDRLERAAALEGPRATPFRDGPSNDAAVAAAPSIAVDIRGLSENDRVEWDAAPRRATLSTPVGEHQLRVLRGERLIWASWVTLDANTRELPLNLPRLEPCSADDLLGTRDGASGPLAPEHARCAEWAVARTVSGEPEVALCRGARCGGWHRAPAPDEPFRGPAQVLSHAGLPRWAMYAIAGLAAATVAGIVISQSGAFGTTPPSRERWVYDGLR